MLESKQLVLVLNIRLDRTRKEYTDPKQKHMAMVDVSVKKSRIILLKDIG
jgi:hypothetical protein